MSPMETRWAETMVPIGEISPGTGEAFGCEVAYLEEGGLETGICGIWIGSAASLNNKK